MEHIYSNFQQRGAKKLRGMLYNVYKVLWTPILIQKHLYAQYGTVI